MLQGKPESGRVCARLEEVKRKAGNQIPVSGVGSLRQLNVLLTTYPGHKSRNVGDNLIASSALSMLQARWGDYDPLILFREESLDRFDDGSVHTVIAPGFSISDQSYPRLFHLYSNLDRLPPFFPIGCSFQHPVPSHTAFDNYRYSDDTLEFFKFITLRSGRLPCRDKMIVKLLERHGVPAVYCGDLALYDETVLMRPFVAPESVQSLVFTIQHHERFEAQSIELLGLIKARFSSARLFAALHSVPGRGALRIANYAAELGYSVLHLYGEVSNLNVYKEVDLHIGYRLHGHIAFLRNRKPTILLIEDARSFGFANTEGTGVGCFDAIETDSGEVFPDTPVRVMDFVDRQIAERFKDYHGVFSFIDETYAQVVKPIFDEIAVELRD